MLQRLLNTLLHPLQSSVLGALAVYLLFSGIARLLFAVASLSGLGGLLIAVVALFFWFTGLVGLTGFAFNVFRASANGRARVPGITADDFRSLWSRRFMAFATLLAAAGFGWSKLAEVLGHPLIDVAAILILFLLPAALALMLLNESLWQALNPWQQLRVVGALGWPYLGLPLALAAAAALVALVIAQGWSWPHGPLLWGYGIMLAVHVCGDVLYRHHERIGLEPVNDQLTLEAIEERERESERDQQLDVAFALARTESAQALEALQPLFAGDADTLPERERVLGIVRQWPNPMVGLRLAQDVIARHLALGNDARAFALTADCLAEHPEFRPDGAEATLRLARIADANGRPRVVTALLGDFARRFPDHPEKDVAALTCASVALEKTSQTALASQQLRILETSRALAHDPGVVRLRRALGEA